jgi:hypothetical protein
MKSKKPLSLSIGLTVLLALSGCASYRSRPLSHLPTRSAQISNEKSVSFAYHIFSKKDCKRYLDRNVIKYGYQPVQITITNNSDKTLHFSRKRISLTTVDVDEVAEKAYTNTAGRSIGYGVGAYLLFWPLAIPAIVDGIGSSKANEKLSNDYNRKILHDQPINPFETVNGLIFVPVDTFTPNFEISLSHGTSSEPIILSTMKPYTKALYA